MDSAKDSSGSLANKRILQAAIVLLAGTAVLAAVVFVANRQPWGYIAPPALSSVNLKRGNVVAYTPWFETATFRGDLLALPVGPTGIVTMLAPKWRAASELDGQDYQTGRRIVTTDGSGNGIPFQFAELTPSQQLQLGSAGTLSYVRGDRSNESTSGLRVRSGVLGDIVHSTPTYVGKPLAGYNFGGYLAFAAAKAGRSPRVYVGANDGMLHAFDAGNGSEVFAYVPSMVMSNLKKLTSQPYHHQYFVDGFLTVEDAQFGGNWHSVLVGGLGAGGRGYFALDVTNPVAASEAAAADKILWEFHSGSSAAGNLGYSYSRPSIVRLNNGKWAAVVANGYLSPTGVASLYILDAQTGSVIREIVVQDSDANGLSSPTLIDTNADGKVDVAYAGDLNGNLWKFDLGSSSASAWGVSYGGRPLFRTARINGQYQAITVAPEVGYHPVEGVMVYVGTGRLLSPSDGIDKREQAVYGIWDKDWSASSVPVNPNLLIQQRLMSRVHASGQATRVATANSIDWTTKRGWVTPTEIAGATSLDQGERVIQGLLLRDGRISFISVNPTLPTGENWFIQLDAITGGAPGKTVVDINSDFLLDVQDNVDGNLDGAVTDIAEDRVVGQYQNFGLASSPVVGILSIGKDSALINHLETISPTVAGDPNDPGLLGGHFDLDTSHLVYPFNSGTTDGHVHQWDDKHNLTTIDYFALPDGSGNPLHEIANSIHSVDPDRIFILTDANDELSPGGVLEINGASISVGEYRNLLNRYLSGNLLPGQVFPRFKLNAPTATEELKGVRQLVSLKLGFDAFAIISGDLLPTETGCVKGNTPGELGEYRNGALMIQALDASDVAGGFVFNPTTQRYEAGSTAIHSTLGYATDGLLWESTVFWHWEGPCYGAPGWADLYDSCVVQGLGGCSKASKNEKKKAKKRKKGKKNEENHDSPPSPPADSSDPPNAPPPGGVTDPGHTVTNTTVGGSNTGRLFWRELVPQE